uniref:Bcl-2-like protein 13 n=1 Tax=Knipowitschia caucasica TaxID=637954 RepID=A0AAV2IXY2_KNICA
MEPDLMEKGDTPSRQSAASPYRSIFTKHIRPRHLEDAVIILEGKHQKESRGGSDDETSLLTPVPHIPWQHESLLASSWSTMEDADIGDPTLEAEPLSQEEQGPETGQRSAEASCLEMEEDIWAPQSMEIIVLAEDPHIEAEPTEFMQVVPPMALPPLPILQLDPPTPTTFCTTFTEAEELFSTPQLLHPPSILTPRKTAVDDPESSQKHSLQATSPQREQLESKPAKTHAITDVPLLLCEGAALIAIVGVVAYGAVALLRK